MYHSFYCIYKCLEYIGSLMHMIHTWVALKFTANLFISPPNTPDFKLGQLNSVLFRFEVFYWQWDLKEIIQPYVVLVFFSVKYDDATQTVEGLRGIPKTMWVWGINKSVRVELPSHLPSFPPVWLWERNGCQEAVQWNKFHWGAAILQCLEAGEARGDVVLGGLCSGLK